MEQPLSPNALLVSSEDKIPDDPQKGSTSKTEGKSSEKNSSNTTKRKYNTKRKSQEILAEIRKEQIPLKVAEEVTVVEEVKIDAPIEEPQAKKIKVVVDDEEEEEESWWRGGVIKPLLLAGIGAASFAVNHLYKTTTKKKNTTPLPPPPPPQQKATRNIMWSTNRAPKIPGFN